MHRQARTPGSTLAERGTNALATFLESGKMCHGLLLLAFFAEDVLAAIFDALALIGFGLAPTAAFRRDRSGERRVGNESVSTCRSRWSPYHYKKNTITQ